ncbi:facilitated trehalose transporter Tret1-like [Diabrotica virgifera virgifera]|uniref:Major facilitator superfamily (MFS) profile domain-containing protein n=1 Tax=Diabrotica virgifera virgifera TaxID=50390 RepID=A0ABM5IPN3_DIAVI|nr:facilitated trehalose transporter Tret1-like [Diabrotica virgifera virgifera]
MWRALLACPIMFLGASIQTWSSSAMPKLVNNETSPFGRALETHEATWVVSSLTLGCAIGTWIASYLAITIGRKRTLLFSGICSLIGNLMIAFGTTVETFYAARLILGFTVTSSMFLVPVYMGEIAGKSKGVFFIAFASTSVCSGLLYSNIIGPFVSISIMSLISALLSFVFCIIFVVFGKETPNFYLKCKKPVLAETVLKATNKDQKHVTEFLLEMQFVQQADESINIFSLYSSKAFKRSLIIVNSLFLIQQLSGVDVLLFYGIKLFQDLDSNITPEVSVNILGLFHLFSSFLLIALGPKFDRKSLFTFSGLGIAFFQACLAIFTYVKGMYPLPFALNILPLFFLVFYIIIYNCGFGPLPFLMLTEILPAKEKFGIISLTATIYWLVVFAITKNFFTVLEILSFSGYFVFCSIVCFLGVIFLRYYLIETKGKTLGEIQHELEQN